MWHSGRRIANASVPWLRGHYARHTAAAASFAGSAVFPWVQTSYPRKFKPNQASHGFSRSYARKIDPGKMVTIQELLQMTDADLADASGVAEQPSDGLKLRAPPERSESFNKPKSPRLQKDPEVLFHHRQPTPKASCCDPAVEVRRLAGYSSDFGSIKIYFERKESESHRPTMKLSKLYLRDICQCSRCVCPSTGEKTFATCDIPDVPRLRDPDTESIRLSPDGGLEITWESDFATRDTHTSVYPLEFLNRISASDGRIYHCSRPPKSSWDTSPLRMSGDREPMVITFDDWMDGGPELGQAVVELYRRGLVIMRGVPRSRDSVQMIAGKIGRLQSTIHGLTWDVVSRPEAENVARAKRNERLHQDLLYWYDPPQLKFLHCLENENQGDLAFFSDGLLAAEELGRKDAASYSALSTQLVTYNYQGAGEYFSRRRRVIQTGGQGQPASIAWSPAFQGPFRISEHRKRLDATPTIAGGKRSGRRRPEEEALRVWSRAAGAFEAELVAPQNMFGYEMKPGECVILDNTRILHAWPEPEAASGPGRRHLRGAYIDEQTLRSALVRLKLAEKDLVSRVAGEIVSGPLIRLHGPEISKIMKRLAPDTGPWFDM